MASSLKSGHVGSSGSSGQGSQGLGVPGSLKRQFSEPEEVSSADSPPSPISAAASVSESPSKRPRTDSETSPDEEVSRRPDPTTANLLELLECPVCFEVTRTGPVFNCRNGHLICSACKPKVKSCPVCRSADLDCRNVFIEKFVSVRRSWLARYLGLGSLEPKLFHTLAYQGALCLTKPKQVALFRI